ncbi:MAG TPA: hypothetical protein VIV15_11140, partial [Anaerolineales bacterium]
SKVESVNSNSESVSANTKPVKANVNIASSSYTSSSTGEEGVQGKEDPSEEELVYEHYPRKVAKKKALERIRAAIAKHGFEKVDTAASNFGLACLEVPEENRDFIPHAATWFFQERYLEPIEPQVAPLLKARRPAGGSPAKPKTNDPRFLSFELFKELWPEIVTKHPCMDETKHDFDHAGYYFDLYQKRLEACQGLLASEDDFYRWVVGTPAYRDDVESHERLLARERRDAEDRVRYAEEERQKAAEIAKWQAAHPGQDYETVRKAEIKALAARVHKAIDSDDPLKAYLTSAPTDAIVTDNIVKPTAEPQ